MADIGTTLREARIRARIDISEVEARTKIRAKYLRAIENEEWDLLPGPVYVKSFLRTYGEYLGLDSRQLVDEFKRRYERPSDQELRPIVARQRARERRPRRRLRLGRIGAVVLVLVIVGAALYVVGTLGKNSSTTTPTTTPTVASGSHSSTSTTTPTTRAATPPPTHRVHHAPPKPTTVTLKLVPTSQVYVCVEDGNGKTLIDGVTFSPGQSVPVETAHKLVVTLGNGAVQMQVNGKPVTLAAGSPIGYSLTPGKTTELSAGQLPTCT